MILSGDIGGTKAELALFERDHGSLREVRADRILTEGHASLEDLLAAFLAAGPGPHSITSAAFGIAGPVIDNQVVGTNLPWTVEAGQVARAIGVARVSLVNDLEATTLGLEALANHDLVPLQVGVPDPRGSIAVIAAGTGLGEAYATREDGRLVARASEGGHGDFAPNSEDEVDLLLYLRSRYGGHVSWERVLSGPGLGNIYDFLKDTGREREPDWLSKERAGGDPNAAIAEADGKAPIATHALDLFVSIYGAEAGNLALLFMATGGVYVAGGIAPKLRSRFEDGRFLAAFRAKGRLSSLLERTPVHLVLNERTALLGAALLASRHAGPVT
ncbi:MAG: glucokinase [Candidatus Eisenbacteria bacterium]